MCPRGVGMQDDSYREVRCGLCQGIFYLCRRCDRGHVYCDETCRMEGNLRARRAAQARHQASELGRQDHRDHQRAYRVRIKLGAGRVTDKGSPRSLASSTVPPTASRSFPSSGRIRVGGRRLCHGPTDLGGGGAALRPDIPAGDQPRERALETRLAPPSPTYLRAARTVLEGLSLRCPMPLSVVLSVDGEAGSSGSQLSRGLGVGQQTVIDDVAGVARPGPGLPDLRHRCRICRREA